MLFALELRRGLLDVGEGSALVGGVLDGFEGEDRRFVSGEEGKLKRVASGVCDHPLNVFGTAECVFVKKFFGGRNVDAIEASRSGSSAVGVEDGADFGGFERADLRDGRGGEVDGELLVGERDVAGDVACGGGGGSPVTSLFGVAGDEAAKKDGCGESSGREKALHLLSMTPCG